MIYDGATRQLKRTIARFKDKAYGATWREDGKLLVAGGQDGIVQVCTVLCVWFCVPWVCVVCSVFVRGVLCVSSRGRTGS